MISVPVVRDADFKKCCMLAGHFDGSRRNYYNRQRRGATQLSRLFSSIVAGDVFVSRANWKLSTAKPGFTKIVGRTRNGVVQTTRKVALSVTCL
jgi:hypothetical protein